MKSLLFLLLTCGLSLAADAPALRKQAAELEKQGNWKEAYEVRIKLLREINDTESGEDLDKAINAQRQLREHDKLDALLDELTVSKKENPQFMEAAGNAYLNGHGHYGQFLDNKFKRGGFDGRGEYRQVFEQDRIRAMQCFMEALRTVEKGGTDEVVVLNSLKQALLYKRTGSHYLWRLFILTDISKSPDYSEQIDEITSEGAPADAEGNPSLIDIPVSWQAAKSDGERWRWILQEIARIDPLQKNKGDLEWLTFCQQHYDVGTLARYSWWSQPDVKERNGILQASTLKETETIARLANGVKRFALREDYQFIPGMRDIMQLGREDVSPQAGDQLVQIFLNRSQLSRASETLRELIKRHGAGGGNQRESLLKQITGNWSRFNQTPTYYAGDPVAVSYTYRNAKETSLKINKVNDELIMQDLIEYLKSEPIEIDYNKVNFHNLGNRLIDQDRKRYVGDEVRSWKQALDPAPNHADTITDLNLGKLAPGCYLLESKIEDGNTSWITIWVRDLVILKRASGDNGVFYLVNAKNGTPVAGEMEFFGYQTIYLDKPKGKRRFDIKTESFRQKTDENGKLQLKNKNYENFQWYVIARSGERRAYLTNQHFNWHDHGDLTDYQAQNTIGITDRPVYRPGQSVQMKIWAGESRYNLADVCAYANKSADITIHDGRGEIVFEKSGILTDAYGGATFEYKLPDEATLGAYNVSVTGSVPNSNFSFRVEEYKKPEYEVIVEAPQEPIALGDQFDVTVLAKYYHGAPVTEATVKVKVQRDFFNNRWFPDGPWDWLYGPGYWWCYSESPWYPGWSNWGCIRPSPPWWQNGRMGAPELIIEQTSPIGADGKVKVTIDSSIAKLVHGDQDHTYSITAEVIDASRRTIVGNGSVLAAREPYAVTVWLDRGYANVGDKVTGTFAARTLDGKKVEGKATAILYSSELNKTGEIEEKEIGKWTPEGENWTFTASKPGQYRVAVEFTDTNGRKQEGATIFSVRGADVKGNFRYNDLELIPDKKEYRPGDTVKLLVNVNQPNSRVWLFIRPSQGKASETQIIHIKGKSQVVEIPLSLADMPNFFIEGVTVAKGQVHTVTREIVLPPEKRQLNIEVKPAKDKLKPREKTSLTVRITDHEGKPFKGSTAITIYDKSLEYISGGSNVSEIVPFFWDWKRHYYGQGMHHSQNLSGYHLQNPQSPFMQNLGIFGHMVGRLEKARGLGSKSKNGGVHAFFAMGAVADSGVGGAPMPAASAKMLESESLSAGEFADTDATGGQAGASPQVMVRSEFADLLKWVGSMETNENGEATIDLEMPDNLTTWKIKTWAMGKGTRVGEGSAEIVTSKDLIIRLQAPRFFVEKDEATLSAIVHNYHKEAKEVTISLELDEKNLTADENKTHKVSIPTMGETRIDWNTKAIAEGETTIRMKAIAADDSDAMEMKFPVYVHGIFKTDSFSRAIAREDQSTSIDFTLPAERRPAESKLTLNYSPSVASAMIDALPYLSSYPYGCTEQTLNRFVPTTVVHHILKDLGHDLAAIKDKKINLNPQQIGDPKERAAQWQPKHPNWNPVWDEKEVAKMEAAGIAKLRDQQNPDGGWGWFSAYGHQSYAHTTAVVMHGLLLARDNGAKVPADMLERGLAWLSKYEETQVDHLIHWKKRDTDTKQKADATDALVRRILGEGAKDHAKMLEFLYRDKVDLPVYAKALVGLEFHRTKDNAKRDDLIRNIRQFLKTDAENQTAYLDLKNGNYWWYWYGSEFEAQAWFLKLLSAAEPNSPDTRGLVKYLINNRKHGTYWNSTRDTAYCIEAIGDFLKATKEGDPNLKVEILLDGKTLKSVEISKDNLFTFDNTAIVAGDILISGKHKIEIRKKGEGPLYANAYVEYFTLEDFITKAGLEVKVDRTYHKLVPDQKVIDAVNSSGQAVDQKRSIYQRIELKSGDEIKSGDLIEVTLGIDSKNDYEYLVFEDWKAAGMEPIDVQSGYNPNGLGAYMELRDEKVSLFVQFLPRGRHNLSYRLRAEIPGKFSALPTHGEAMYAPELRANSDEMKFIIKD